MILPAPNPHRINRAMKDCHAAFLELGNFTAAEAYQTICEVTGTDMKTAKELFGIMRIMGAIRDNEGAEDGFHAAPKKGKRVDGK